MCDIYKKCHQPTALVHCTVWSSGATFNSQKSSCSWWGGPLLVRRYCKTCPWHLSSCLFSLFRSIRKKSNLFLWLPLKTSWPVEGRFSLQFLLHVGKTDKPSWFKWQMPALKTVELRMHFENPQQAPTIFLRSSSSIMHVCHHKQPIDFWNYWSCTVQNTQLSQRIE